jgi:hypothetical protein
MTEKDNVSSTNQNVCNACCSLPDEIEETGANKVSFSWPDSIQKNATVNGRIEPAEFSPALNNGGSH